jgi:hypothetical protein
MAMMDDINKDNPPPPAAASAEAETAHLTAQVLEVGRTEKDRVAETVKNNADSTSDQKKVPQAGLKNYFVSLPVSR